MSQETAFDGQVRSKREELKSSISQLKVVSVEIKDELEADRDRVRKLSNRYQESGSLLANTFKALDGLLDESEVRLAIYVGGVLFLLFLLVWKLS
jgi:uncharacterized coiled-coil DUF342 family protein